MTSNFISIGELARQTGFSTHTLRYYESVGVLRPISRSANGHRQYHSDDILWLAFVLKLKLTGMPLAEIKQYAQFRAQGEMTLSQRLTMLKLHRERLVAKMAELSECANALDEKLRTYRMMVAKSKARIK